ncbi:hypothetical protein B0I35DRAFT_515907 [Stachybotrys elegans]|uniref:Uncharacterized protein n=1 Tax=Stachybotrys elegans TaxID=80388 RepID=A0A8K0SH72_9HYPO|nr:hypothetical protein B0I35DRAFT_515907 [Stachybotrys elegans]
MVPALQSRRLLSERRSTSPQDMSAPVWTLGDEEEEDYHIYRKRSSRFGLKRGSPGRTTRASLSRRQDPAAPVAAPGAPEPVSSESESEDGSDSGIESGSDSSTDEVENEDAQEPGAVVPAPALPAPSSPAASPTLAPPQDIETPPTPFLDLGLLHRHRRRLHQQRLRDLQANLSRYIPPPQSTSTRGGPRTTMIPPPGALVPVPTRSASWSTVVSLTTSQASWTTTSAEPSFESILDTLPTDSFEMLPTGGSFSSGLPAPTESAASDRAEVESPGRASPSPAERALHAMGAIGGVFFILGFIYLLWRFCRKRTRGGEKGYGGWSGMSSTASSTSSSAWTSISQRIPFLVRIPFFGKRLGGGWRPYPKAEEPYPTIYEKNMPAYSQDASFYPPSQTMNASQLPPTYFVGTTPVNAGHMPQQSISTNSADYNSITPPAKRYSEVSSLSSGFGDGDIIVPPSAESTMRQSQNYGQPSAPRAAAQRASRRSWFTEASEDSLPRFRTVKSWVNQQTGRIVRQKQRDEEQDVPPVPGLPPAEQEFIMMMPDGQEPRRVLVR